MDIPPKFANLKRPFYFSDLLGVPLLFLIFIGSIFSIYTVLMHLENESKEKEINAFETKCLKSGEQPIKCEWMAEMLRAEYGKSKPEQVMVYPSE